jgi:pilus assembly protein CpaC
VVLLALPVAALGQKAMDLPSESVTVHVGQSKLLEAPWPVKRVSVTNPAVADVEAITTQRIMVLGRKIGSTDVMLWNDQEQARRVQVDVTIDLQRIREEFKRLFPDSNLDIMQSQDVVIVMGTLQSGSQAEALTEFLTASSQATGLEYVNMTKVESKVQPVAIDAKTGQAVVEPGTKQAERQALQPVKLDEEGFLDPRLLQAELQRLFPGSKLDVRASEDVYVISGMLRRAEDAEKMQIYLTALSESEATKDLQFVNLTGVAGVHQVLLQVRFAEASRSAVRTLGINILQTGHHDNTFFGATQPGPDQSGALTPISIGPPEGAVAGNHNAVPFTFNRDVDVSPLTSVILGFPRADLEFFIRALTENRYVRLLAEPNLVAMSGEEASFLAGGEFPIPIVQGTGGTTAISIEFKEFGIRLNFRPTVLGENALRLHVAPEVSELSPVGAVEIQGFRVPSLITRRAETTVELMSGQTMIMAGLLSESNRGISSKLPGVGQIPILGSLFRSVNYEEGKTELLVMVQAWVVEPQSLEAPPPLPGVLHTRPNDWELYALGQIEGQAAPQLSPTDAEWLRDLGLDQLRGPGAWARYEQGTATSEAPIEPTALPGDEDPAGQ